MESSVASTETKRLSARARSITDESGSRWVMGTLRLRPAICLRTEDARPGKAAPVRMTMDMDGRGASG